MEGMVRVNQEDLVVVEGWGCTELGQLFVPTWTRWYVGFVVEQLRLLFLAFSSLLKRSAFGVIVHLGFGGGQGTRTAQGIVILDADDGCFFNVQVFESLMTRFGTAWSSGREGHPSGLLLLAIYWRVIPTLENCW